jgi:uncharacterized membrane protein
MEKDPVEAIWNKVRPYWHIATFVITIAVICGMKWSEVNTYDSRIIALELWRVDVSQNMATMQQEIHDIHERVLSPELNDRRR